MGDTAQTRWTSGFCEAGGVDIHYLRTGGRGPAVVLLRLLGQDQRTMEAQIRSRHPRRSLEMVELLARAKLKTRLSAFDVLAPPNPDYRRLMRAIDVPILVVIADDGVVSPETARELQGLNPDVRIELIRDAGHGVQYDQPERFEAAVRWFLRSVGRS